MGFRCALVFGLGVLIAAAPAPGPLPLDIAWRDGIPGTSIGVGGLVPADLDGDGDLEIVAGGRWSSSYFWHVHEHQAGGGYRMTWISEALPTHVTALAVLDPDGDGLPRVFVGVYDGDVRIFDGSTRAPVALLPGASEVRRIFLADADNDAAPELVVVSTSATALYDPVTLAFERSIAYGGSDADCGNVDADPALELVYAGGTVVQLDGAIPTVQWTYSAGEFGARVRLADVDADGRSEILGASAWYTIRCLDADTQTLKWSASAQLDITAFLLQDVTGDGVVEVIYGDGQWGEIHCLSAATQAELWNIPNPEHSVTYIAIADVDGDSAPEVLWGAGHTSSGQDLLLVAGLASKLEEWRSDPIDGPFRALAVGDTDGDGDLEIVAVSHSSESGYDDGIVLIFDAASRALLWKSPHSLFEANAWTGIHAVAIGDVDGDGAPEIVVGTDDLYDGAIYVFEGSTRTLEDKYLFTDSSQITSLAIVDVDLDGQTEIVAAGSRVSPAGLCVYVLNGATGVPEWTSDPVAAGGLGVQHLRVGEVTGSGAPEIVLIADQKLWIFDGATHASWQSLFSGCSSLDLADVDGDQRLDVVYGTTAGFIAAIDAVTKLGLLNVDVSASTIDALAARDLDGDGAVEYAICAAGSADVFAADGTSRLAAPIPLGPSAGLGDALLAADLSGGAAAELFAGTEYSLVVGGGGAGGGGGGGGVGVGGCGALGIEVFLLFILARRRRR